MPLIIRSMPCIKVKGLIKPCKTSNPLFVSHRLNDHRAWVDAYTILSLWFSHHEIMAACSKLMTTTATPLNIWKRVTPKS
ncbi:hypothetical protein GDO78_011094 [Eleutherodactylus coqui]|uniref:Uncharacterized protein n=1 Tax=Eleutherodactylus coqui TaxID=57060 RepID=A0A8J6K629_ELECQ|nr:hypothetical protein GDO78_011094 [Eleutherodactylus coqui]